MVSLPSIAAALLLQLTGISIFIRQTQDRESSTLPAVSNWLFTLALVLLLWNNDLLPKRYALIAPRMYFCVELLGTIFIAELAAQVGWSSYERVVLQLSQLSCQNYGWCNYLMVYALTLLPPVLLLCILTPAQWRECIVQLIIQLPRPETDECLMQCARELSNYVHGLICFCQLKRRDRLRAIRVFQLQAERRNRRDDHQLELES